MVAGARAELHERMKRKPDWAGAPSSSARPSSTWWMVGTAEYQLTPWARAVGQKALALKRGGTTTVAPADSEERVAPMSPWTWKRGMTTSPTSVGPSA